MHYELKIEKFQGPLEKLLELIEERKMEIGEISLAQVTDDFLRYLGELTKEGKKVEKEGDLSEAESYMRLVADFIVVASRLIFLKSKSLLPGTALGEEEEAGIKELEARLKLYKELRPAMKAVAKLWQAKNVEFARPYFLNVSRLTPEGGAGGAIFYPGEKLDLAALAASLGKLYETLGKLALETEEIKGHIISLEEKINEVLARVKEIGETSFARLGGAQSRGELIVMFLALLHLAREKLVSLEQREHLSDIIITKSS